MLTVDERAVHAPATICFHVAADVERWPEILAHYRYVRFHRKDALGLGCVEMAAWRPFAGPLRYPTWWLSEMRADPIPPRIDYRHVGGITRGMDVRWEFIDLGDHATRVRIVHEWSGPAWPLVGGIAARHVIGPYFVSAIASRTLKGVGVEAERRWAARGRKAPAEPGHD